MGLGTAVPRVLPIAAQRGGFKLRQRAEHVYGECLRPDQFAEICGSSAEAKEKLGKLGKLMDDSQASCRCGTSPFICDSLLGEAHSIG